MSECVKCRNVCICVLACEFDYVLLCLHAPQYMCVCVCVCVCVHKINLETQFQYRTVYVAPLEACVRLELACRISCLEIGLDCDSSSPLPIHPPLS